MLRRLPELAGRGVLDDSAAAAELLGVLSLKLRPAHLVDSALLQRVFRFVVFFEDLKQHWLLSNKLVVKAGVRQEFDRLRTAFAAPATLPSSVR